MREDYEMRLQTMNIKISTLEETSQNLRSEKDNLNRIIDGLNKNNRSCDILQEELDKQREKINKF